MAESQEQKATPHSSKSRLVWFVLLGMVILGFIILLGAWMKRSNVKSLLIGQTVSDFSLTSFDEKSYKLSDFHDKVVLINLWASWCYTCDDESYFLQQIWSEVEPSGEIFFLGVDYVDTEKPALEFINKHGMTYPNGPDLGSKISKLFKTTGVPETFLIGRDGTLKAIKIGPFLSVEDVRDFLLQADR